MKHLLIILSILLLSSPVIGQSINCNKKNIKRKIDFGWSVDEIKEVCGKYTKPSKPEKVKVTKTPQKPKKNITSKKLLPLFGQSECDETTRARMIKSGLSDKTIEEQCGKIGEKGIVSEKIEKTEDDLKISVESKKPYQAQIILLSSLGSGISLYYYFKNDIWFGIDSQSTSGSRSSTFATGEKSEVNLNFSTNYLNARYYLIESMPSFFIQGGFVSRRWTIEVVESRASNNKILGKYSTKYPSSALNMGLGWNWISDQGFSGGIHFIGLIGGSPLHTYETDSSWICDDSCKASYETYIDEYNTNSTLHLNIGYNFNF